MYKIISCPEDLSHFLAVMIDSIVRRRGYVRGLVITSVPYINPEDSIWCLLVTFVE